MHKPTLSEWVVIFVIVSLFILCCLITVCGQELPDAIRRNNACHFELNVAEFPKLQSTMSRQPVGERIVVYYHDGFASHAEAVRIAARHGIVLEFIDFADKLPPVPTE